MPRINIHEVDNTKPGSRAYSNYSVVVPGFHAPYMTEFDDINLRKEINGIILQKEVKTEDGAKIWVPYSDEDIFGDTGILEIKTQADFEQYIGLLPPQRFDEGVNVTVVADEILSTNQDSLMPNKKRFYHKKSVPSGGRPEESEFSVVQDKDENTITFTYLMETPFGGKITVNCQPFIYTINGLDIELFETEIDDHGRLSVSTSKPNPVSKDEVFVELNADQDIVRAGITINVDNKKHKIGFIVPELTAEEEAAREAWIAEGASKQPAETRTEADWTLDRKGDIYKAAFADLGDFTYEKEVAVPAHYGNQIAYELLGLGYTVYYLNMGEFNTTKRDANDKSVGLLNIFEAFRQLGREVFWAELRDKTTYDYRFVLTGFIEDGNGHYDLMKNANYEISKLASWEKPGDDPFAHVRARGDVLALVDLDEYAIRANFASTANGLGNTTKRTIQAIQKELSRQNFGLYGKYSAVFTPSVTYTNNLKTDFFNNSHFPASFHYLACFAKSVFADNYKEWFAVAGFTRGLSTYNIDSTAFKLGDIAVQALEPRYLVDGTPVNVACNVIVHNRGSYYIWGNRTAHALLKTELVASHFLNIRQLCITLKKFIYNLCRNFTFDPNSDILWSNFVTALTPLLEQMKANQGIRDYLIEKVPTDLKGVLSARVRIVPIEAVEDFEIEVALEDSIGGTTATVNE